MQSFKGPKQICEMIEQFDSDSQKKKLILGHQQFFNSDLGQNQNGTTYSI